MNIVKDKRFWAGFLVAYAALTLLPQLSFASITGGMGAKKNKGGTP